MRPFPTPVRGKILSRYASDKWGPTGLLKKNATPCVCALLSAAQTSQGTGCEPTKAHTGSLCSVPSEEAETCRRQAMTPHAPPCPPEPIVLLGSDCFQLGCPPMRAGAGSTQALCPATAFLQPAQDSQSRDLALIFRLSWTQLGLFQTGSFQGKAISFETSRKNWSFNCLHLTEGYIPVLLRNGNKNPGPEESILPAAVLSFAHWRQGVPEVE